MHDQRNMFVAAGWKAIVLRGGWCSVVWRTINLLSNVARLCRGACN